MVGRPVESSVLMHVVVAVMVDVPVPHPPSHCVAQGLVTVWVGVVGQRGLCAGTVVNVSRIQNGRMQVVVMNSQSDCSGSTVVVTVKQSHFERPPCLACERLEGRLVVETRLEE
jgi:hypothetical protein